MNSWGFSDVDLSTSFDDSMCGIGNEFMNAMFSMRDALSALPLCDDSPSSLAGVKLEDHQVPSSSLPCFTSQFIETTLKASTSSATRFNEPTLTYLNQGQPYELVFQPISDNIASVKSIVRVRFHEHRMEVNEREHLEAWRLAHSGERLLDVDMDRSRGYEELSPDGDSPNTVVCTWRAADFASDRGGGEEVGATHRRPPGAVVALRLNCIGTEFTVKKHGGERGISFRLQVDHFDGESGRALESCACQVQVFKMKGADRKHRTDREKIERKSQDGRSVYQAAHPVTLLLRLTGPRASSLVNTVPPPASTPPNRYGPSESRAAHLATAVSGQSNEDVAVEEAVASRGESGLLGDAVSPPASATVEACFGRALVGRGVQNSPQEQTEEKPVGLCWSSPAMSTSDAGEGTIFPRNRGGSQVETKVPGPVVPEHHPVPSVSGSFTPPTRPVSVSTGVQKIVTPSKACCETLISAGAISSSLPSAGVQRRRRLRTGNLDHHHLCVGCCSTCGHSCRSHTVNCPDDGPCLGSTGRPGVTRGAKFRPCWLSALGSGGAGAAANTTPSSSSGGGGGGGGGRMLFWENGPGGAGGGRQSAKLSATWMSEKRRASSNGYEQLRRDVSGLSVGGIRRQPKGGVPQSATTGAQRLRHHNSHGHHHHHQHQSSSSHSHFNLIPTTVGAIARELSTSLESNLCGEDAQQQPVNCLSSCRQPAGQNKPLDAGVDFTIFPSFRPALSHPQPHFLGGPGIVRRLEEPQDAASFSRDGGYSSGDVPQHQPEQQQRQEQPIIVCESIELGGEEEPGSRSEAVPRRLVNKVDDDDEEGDADEEDVEDEEEEEDGDDGDDEGDGDEGEERVEGARGHLQAGSLREEVTTMRWAGTLAEEQVGDDRADDQLGVGMSPDEVASWLRRENFSHLVDRFLYFTGRDMLRLTKEDYTSLCGGLEGLRLYNAIYHRLADVQQCVVLSSIGRNHSSCQLVLDASLSVCSVLSVDQHDHDAPSTLAMVRQAMTRGELLLHLATLLGRRPEQIELLCLVNEEHGIPILLTDRLLAQLEDHSCYELVDVPGSLEGTNLFLKPV